MAGPSWYLREWMDSLNVRQRDMIEKAGWSRATASQLYNGTQDYSPKLVAEAAEVMHLEPFELLMLPEEAMALRNMRSSAVKIADLARPVSIADDEPVKRTGSRG